MEQLVANSIISGILAIAVFISGIWLRKTGEPYKTGIFALHKITVVATAVFIVLIVIQHLRVLNFAGTGLILFVLSVIFFLVAFVSGAVLSFENTARDFLKIIHRISSVLVLIMVPVIWLYCH
jgi:4-amino-4-deoxy-L-arabinose transferase-like glycosyltransferase